LREFYEPVALRALPLIKLLIRVGKLQKIENSNVLTFKNY